MVPGETATPRVFDVAPSALAVTRAIEDLYRDIEALRALVSDARVGPDLPGPDASPDA
jgi:hypothetical protein